MKLTHLSHSGKFQLCAIALAVLAGSNAYAGNPVVTPSFDQAPVTDTTTTGVVAGTATTNNFNIDKYSGPGVLTGASFTATFGQEAITFTNLSPAGDSKSKIGSAFGSADLSVGGVTGSGVSAGTGSVTVAKGGETATTSSAAYTVSGTATAAQLANFYSTSAAPVSGTLAEKTNMNLTGGKTNYVADGMSANAASHTATVTASYTSVNHADGALGTGTSNSLSYSFGDIANGAAPTAYGFDLYNLLGSYGLQVVSVTPTATSGAFALSGITTGTTNLAAGSFVTGTVGMAAQTVAGLYSGSWAILVADSSLGIGAGKNTTGIETLTLHVDANVTPVPEPESYAMLLAGLGLMGTIARRRNKDKAA